MRYFEIAKRNSRGGKRRIKVALHEIYDDVMDTNKNGLHWKEEYVLDALPSAINIPLCAEFVDDNKTVPLGHGMTSVCQDDNEPLFENSEVVGTITNAYIDTVSIDGVDKKVLIGDGYIYQQRYPNFTKWLVRNVAENRVMSSIEIMGVPENSNMIVYEEDNPTQEYRTPKTYLYSGSALLSVEPADDSALVLQMNSCNKNNEESEVNEMDEKTISLIADAVKNAVTETNSKNAEYEQTIAELNQVIAERDSQIVELNASSEEIKKALDDVKSQMDSIWEERRILEEELAKARVAERLGEFNTAMAQFSEDEKALASEEVAKFEADPMNVEINSVVNAIYCAIGKQSKEKVEEPVVEINSADIYSEVAQPEAQVGEDTEVSIY